jgi:hypothetical protein
MTDFLSFRLSARIPSTLPVGKGIINPLLNFVDFPVYVAPKESDILCDIHIGRAVFVAHSAEETREDSLGVVKDLFFKAEYHIAKELSREQFDLHGAHGRTDATIHASSSIE